MNLLRNVNKIGAALFCAAGMLTSTFAIAGGQGGGSDVKIDDLDCELQNEHLKIWGELKHRDDEELKVKIEVKGFVKVDDCNGEEKVWFEIKEKRQIGGGDHFNVNINLRQELRDEIEEECGESTGMPDIEKIVVKKVIVKLIEDGDVVDVAKCEVDEHGERECRY